MNKILKTHVAIVLDRSGSMASTAAETVKAYNEHVEQMKLNSKDGQQIFCSLVSFNGDVFEHLWNVPADQLTLATVESYQPMGSTAMRDAIGYTTKKLLDTTDTNDPDTAYLVLCISDGEENASRHFSIPALKELIESCQATKKWTFTYIGCDEDYLKQIAATTSIPLANMAKAGGRSGFSGLAGLAGTSGYSGYSGIGDYYALRRKGETYTANAFSADSSKSADFTNVDVTTHNVSATTGTEGSASSTNIFFTTNPVKEWDKYGGEGPSYK